MTPGSSSSHSDEPEWRSILLGTDRRFSRYKRLMQRMPGSPRCHFCGAPFHGLGSPLARMMGSGRWEKNPNYCVRCFRVLDRNRGGADIPCSVLFADIRGSTTIAEHLSGSDFKDLVQRFYAAAAEVLFRHDAILDKFVGDEVMAIFIPASPASSTPRAPSTPVSISSVRPGTMTGTVHGRRSASAWRPGWRSSARSPSHRQRRSLLLATW